MLENNVFAAHFGAGLMAESFSCVLWVPIDVIKERMQIQGPTATGETVGVQYKGAVDAIGIIAKTEGLRGLYKGYGATLLSFGPYSALYFLFYEKFKSAVASAENREVKDLKFGTVLCCATASGAVASFITNPLDLIKLRLQVQRGSAQSSQFMYTGFFHALSTIRRQEGAAALFRGVGARILFFAPSSAITMSIFEMAKGWFDQPTTQ